MDESKKHQFPPQQQEKPGVEAEMTPQPRAEDEGYRGSGKLLNKIALITGGDSGIGRAVALAFAKEGADCVISYYTEHQDAEDTRESVEAKGRTCITIAGDLADEEFCRRVVYETVRRFGRVDILVNNAGVQYESPNIEDITLEQLDRSFKVNIIAMFHVTKAALKHMKAGGTIINTSSVTAYRGSRRLLDYSTTKGAIISFTRSLSLSLADRGIRVNAVAPGPVWTPLVPAGSSPGYVEQFGSGTLMGRAGQPEEIAPAYVFLASDESSYMSGQVLHPNGGEIINT